LRAAHSVGADYMPAMREEPEFVDFCDISPELSRGDRGLRIWIPMRLHGASVFRANLDEKLDLARWAAQELRALPGIRIVAPPELSLLAFRIENDALSGEEIDRRNTELLERINARRRVYLTATRVQGRFTLRICVLSFRTHMDRMQECLDIIREELANC